MLGYSCIFHLQVLCASVARLYGVSGSSARDLICDAVTVCSKDVMNGVSLDILRVFHVRKDGEPPVPDVDVECWGWGVALLSCCCVRWGRL